jgi:nitrogen fixation NifU-like protein
LESECTNISKTIIGLGKKLKTKNMAYGEKVIDHYQNPRNVGTLDKSKPTVGTGLVGAPECGDVMRLQIEIEDGIIKDAKFKTFGCGSAIAASSLATEWLKGRSVEEAAKLDNMDLVEELNLPPVKIHCSVLAQDAVQAAINDYRQKNGLEPIQFEEKLH